MARPLHHRSWQVLINEETLLRKPRSNLPCGLGPLMRALGTDSRQTSPETLTPSAIETLRQVGGRGSRRNVIARRDGVAQSGGIGPIEQMKQWNRSDLVTRQLQGASALPLRCGFCGKGLEHIA